METLITDLGPFSVLCQMGNFGCGEGGWTPVMKIDGSKVYLSICISFHTITINNHIRSVGD